MHIFGIFAFKELFGTFPKPYWEHEPKLIGNTQHPIRPSRGAFLHIRLSIGRRKYTILNSHVRGWTFGMRSTQQKLRNTTDALRRNINCEYPDHKVGLITIKFGSFYFRANACRTF